MREPREGLFESKGWKAAKDDYLKENSYASVGEWALDSDYIYDPVSRLWFDDTGCTTVDIDIEFFYALESAGYFD